MITFEQFLENIAKKVGPYTGDPIQALAVRDISDEDQLGLPEIEEYYLRPIRQAAERMLEILRQSEIQQWSTADNLLIHLTQFVDTLQQSRLLAIRLWRYVFDAWKSLSESRFGDPILASKLSPSIREISNLMKGLSRRGVKAVFATRGKDHKMYQALNSLLYAGLDTDPTWSDAEVDQIVRRHLDGQDLGRRITTAMSTMAYNMVSALDQGQEPPQRHRHWNLFMQLMNDDRFFQMMNPRYQQMIRLVRQQAGRQER